MKRNRFRILVAVSLVVTVLFGAAGAFYDVDTATNEGKAIIEMQSHGYIKGFEDGSFRPNATLTRAEFVTIINKMYDYTVDTENVFKDIAEKDWYYKDVLIAVQAGYIKGMDDGSFKPNVAVTREQVCVMLNRILNAELLPTGVKITDEVSDWARDSVERLVSNRLFALEEGGKFRGTQPITRGEACAALEKCIVEEQIDIEPIDIESIAREELEKKLSNMIVIMETKIIPSCLHKKSHEISTRITESMKKYLEDEGYDYLEDAKATYQIYKGSGEASKELKSLIFANVNMEDISILLGFFYTPEIGKTE